MMKILELLWGASGLKNIYPRIAYSGENWALGIKKMEVAK